MHPGPVDPFNFKATEMRGKERTLMFHVYILASSGRRIDYHRAMWLMDRKLLVKAKANSIVDLQESLALYHAALEGRGLPYRSGPPTSQEIKQNEWERYTSLHYTKYGEDFEPDVSPIWDS